MLLHGRRRRRPLLLLSLPFRQPGATARFNYGCRSLPAMVFGPRLSSNVAFAMVFTLSLTHTGPYSCNVVVAIVVFFRLVANTRDGWLAIGRQPVGIKNWRCASTPVCIRRLMCLCVHAMMLCITSVERVCSRSATKTGLLQSSSMKSATSSLFMQTFSITSPVTFVVSNMCEARVGAKSVPVRYDLRPDDGVCLRLRTCDRSHIYVISCSACVGFAGGCI